MSNSEDPAAEWLSAEERAAWLSSTAFFMTRLPAALDAQLQRDAGLSFFEYMVLAVLAEQPDRTLQMSDIAAAASASLSRLSHTAARLEKKGYLVRTRCGGAGRRTNATLTEAGFDKAVASAPGHVAAVRALVFDVITPEQRESLGEISGLLLQQLTGDASPPFPDARDAT